MACSVHHHVTIYSATRFRKTRVNSSYTAGVKNFNFIHALLVAVLCYGQLVANIHAISHFDVHTHEGAEQLHRVSHNDSSHNALTRAAFTADHHAHHAPASGDTESNPDCAIYHTYLNQLTILCAPGHHDVALLPR